MLRSIDRPTVGSAREITKHYDDTPHISRPSISVCCGRRVWLQCEGVATVSYVTRLPDRSRRGSHTRLQHRRRHQKEVQSRSINALLYIYYSSPYRSYLSDDASAHMSNNPSSFVPFRIQNWHMQRAGRGISDSNKRTNKTKDPCVGGVTKMPLSLCFARRREFEGVSQIDRKKKQCAS